MKLALLHSQLPTAPLSIKITGSKSESNRLLILKYLSKNLSIDNVSNSDDSQVLTKALSSIDEIIDIHHAGTAMRFLTAYQSLQANREVVLTGSSRMQERPIGILVDALRSLGADISYEKEEGYPPLRIKGKQLTANKVTLKANVSSQYISALLLIAPFLENGMTLELVGEITSVPYIKMTLSLLDKLGAKTKFEGNQISIEPGLNQGNGVSNFTVESDWSSASYFYSLVALSNVGCSITLSSYKQDSLQGDACLATLYEDFGVQTSFNETTVTLKKVKEVANETEINFNLVNAPDIAQTIAVTAYGLGVKCDLTGLHTLKIKETDRLEALQAELSKLGATIKVTGDSLHLSGRNGTINKSVAIDTYQDHRMAMAFAPLALKTEIVINEAEVVSKSYPSFWEDMKAVGIQINKL